MTIKISAAKVGETPETGIASDDMYRVSQFFFEHVRSLELSAGALRLLHALLHATCRDIPAWSEEVMQPDEGFRRPSLVLRRVLGLEAANGNRDLTAGAGELFTSGLFEFLRYAHGNTWLCWRFTDQALAAALCNRRYALFDARHLPGLRTRTDVVLHKDLALVRRMRRGAFELHLDDMSQGLTWTTGSRAVLAALRHGATRHNLLLVVLLDCTGVARGTDTVHVRAWRPGCTWTIRDLVKVSPSTRRCLLVDGAGHVAVEIGALRNSMHRVADAGWSLAALRN